MHEKSLNEAELNRVFQKYDDIPNINEINFLGKISKTKSSSGLANPYYRMIKPKGENVPSFPTARVMVEIPSPFRVGNENNSYVTKLSIFTTDESALKFKDILSPEEVEYIAGTGKIQDYKVVQKSKPSLACMNFLNDLIVNRIGENEDKVMDVARLLGLYIDSNSKQYMKLSTIWSNNIMDGSSLAKKKISEGKLPEENRVRLQGLVYMPPSIRQSSGEKGNYLHVKIRVKRQMEIPDQNVPLMYQSQFDYINAIAFGENALDWFEKTKQGHPVYIEGRLESSKFRKYRQITREQRAKVASFLGVEERSPFIDMIEQYFIRNKEIIEYPNFNVWIDTLETEEGTLVEK